MADFGAVGAEFAVPSLKSNKSWTRIVKASVCAGACGTTLEHSKQSAHEGVREVQSQKNG